MRISNFLVGLFVSLIVVVSLFGFTASLMQDYGIPGDYDETKMERLGDSLDELENLSQELKSDVETSNVSSNPLDVVGDLLGQGYGSVQIAGKSLPIFSNMIGIISEDVRLGSQTQMIVAGLIFIVTTLFILALVGVITGRDRI